MFKNVIRRSDFLLVPFTTTNRIQRSWSSRDFRPARCCTVHYVPGANLLRRAIWLADFILFKTENSHFNPVYADEWRHHPTRSTTRSSCTSPAQFQRSRCLSWPSGATESGSWTTMPTREGLYIRQWQQPRICWQFCVSWQSRTIRWACRHERVWLQLMSSLSKIWKDKRLSVATQIRIYQVLPWCLGPTASETWTLAVECRRQVSGGVIWNVSDRCLASVGSITSLSRLQQNTTSNSCVPYQERPPCSVWSHRQTTRQRPSSSGASNRHQPFIRSPSTKLGLEASSLDPHWHGIYPMPG